MKKAIKAIAMSIACIMVMVVFTACGDKGYHLVCTEAKAGAGTMVTAATCDLNEDGTVNLEITTGGDTKTFIASYSGTWSETDGKVSVSINEQCNADEGKITTTDEALKKNIAMLRSGKMVVVEVIDKNDEGKFEVDFRLTVRINDSFNVTVFFPCIAE